MQLPHVFRREDPIPALKASGDINALIRFLGHPDFSVRSKATEALVSSGEGATGSLIAALDFRKSAVRIGVAEVLGSRSIHAAMPALISHARYDTSIDVRLAALLALGEIGDPAAIPCCMDMLKDSNRYVRYGAAIALNKLRWEPSGNQERAFLGIALEDWKAVRALGRDAAGSLSVMLRADDANTRVKMIELLSLVGPPEATDGCARALLDCRDSVRYMGLISSIRCGLSAERLPLLLARRERTGPNPAAAAFLNFLFPGIGYNYIGKWWGFLVFMSFMSIMVLAQLRMGPFVPYLVAYPVTAVIAVQTYFEAKRIADNSGGEP